MPGAIIKQIIGDITSKKLRDAALMKEIDKELSPEAILQQSPKPKPRSSPKWKEFGKPEFSESRISQCHPSGAFVHDQRSSSRYKGSPVSEFEEFCSEM